MAVAAANEALADQQQRVISADAAALLRVQQDTGMSGKIHE
jgi:hypothetical protein